MMQMVGWRHDEKPYEIIQHPQHRERCDRQDCFAVFVKREKLRKR